MKLATTTLVCCVAALLALGMVMLYSSGMVQFGAHYFQMQFVWCGLGLAVGAVLMVNDYRALKRYAVALLVLSVVMLVLVLIPGIGLKVNGARRWFRIGEVRFQPSEVAKISLLIFVAWYADRYQRLMPTFWRGLARPGLVIGLVLGLIFVEPDRGSCILLGSVCGIMLLVAGARWKFFLPPCLLLLTGFVVSLLNDPMRMGRIFSWLDLEANKQGVGYQAWQARLALGSGGWTGVGLGDGRQKLGFVPEHHTDFIFSIIGEELGLVATLLVVLAFVLLVLCGAYIAWRARDIFGQSLAAGITFLIGLQAFINIGVVTNVLPNKGLPLPFISYGGSNLLVMLASVGLLLSISRQARQRAGQTESPRFDEMAAPQIT